MTVTVAKNAGFCFGVARAAKAVEELATCQSGEAVYTFGELIHNRVYNASLTALGVTVVETLEEAKNIAESGKRAVLVIRTHGVPRDVQEGLLRLSRAFPNFRVVDMTCPFVSKIHKIAEEHTTDNSIFCLLATDGHPESVGIVSHAKGKVITFRTKEELVELLKPYKDGNFCMLLASQTTQSGEEFKKTKLFFKKHFTNSKIFDTICNVTDIRQEEAEELSRRSDRMIVVGGKNSSNTQKLFDICKKNCAKTYWIETRDEIKALPIDGTEQNIGITAGASTPAGLIKEIEHQWKK